MKKVVNASKIIEKGQIAKIANKVQKTTRGIKYRKKKSRRTILQLYVHCTVLKTN
jgi:hypothetical protein